MAMNKTDARLRALIAACLAAAAAACATEKVRPQKSDQPPGIWRGFQNRMLLNIGRIELSDLTAEELREIAEFEAESARRAWAEIGFTVQNAKSRCQYFVIEQHSKFYLAENDSCRDVASGNRGYGDMGQLFDVDVQIEGQRCDLKSVQAEASGEDARDAFNSKC